MYTLKNISYSVLMESVEKHYGEYIDTLPGSLIDDLYISVDGGYLVCFETFQNCWNSVYTVYYFSEEESKAAGDLWEERKQAYIKEYGEPDIY